MWNLLHVMQILIFFINVLSWPANTEYVLLSIEEAVNLRELTEQVYQLVLPPEFLDGKDWNSPDGPSTSLILSIAIFGVVLLGLVILLILYCLLKSIAEKARGLCAKIWLVIQASLFYNLWLRYMIEGTLDLSYQSIFYLNKKGSFESTQVALETIISVFFVICIGLWLIFGFSFLVENKKFLKQD